MIFVDVCEAQNRLSELIKQAAAGEEVVVATAGRPPPGFTETFGD